MIQELYEQWIKVNNELEQAKLDYRNIEPSDKEKCVKQYTVMRKIRKNITDIEGKIYMTLSGKVYKLPNGKYLTASGDESIIIEECEEYTE